MKILVTDADETLRKAFSENISGHEIVYTDDRISLDFLQQHSDAEVLSVFVCSAVPKECIDALPHLKLIAARSTGVDHIDRAYAKERGIMVSNVAKYGARTVAEFTFALLLGLSRRIPEAVRRVREEGDFSTAGLEGFDLFGKTIGIVGTGAIGRNVVRIASGFGMHVLMFDKFPDASLEAADARYVSLETLLAEADIVSLHVPYIPENHHLLSAERIATMKKGAYIVNTARGELIDTAALIEALTTKHIAGAALDVLEGERVLVDEIELARHADSVEKLQSVVRDHVLLRKPEVIVTPHSAFFSREAYHEILRTTIDSIIGLASGTPRNVLS